MADLSKFTLPSGTTYDIKDSTARSELSNKAPLASPALTGTPTAPTATEGTNNTQIATTAFVTTAIASALAGAAAFQGVVNSGSEISSLTDYSKGMYWVVGTAGTYVGQTCEQGDFIFCISDFDTAYSVTDFAVVQANLDMSVFGDLAFKDSASGTFTPSGSVSAPTISVASAGSTASVAKNIVAVAPGESAPSNPITYYSVSNETLSLYQIGYGTETVKTSDASYSSSQPTFTGTEGNVSVS